MRELNFKYTRGKVYGTFISNRACPYSVGEIFETTYRPAKRIYNIGDYGCTKKCFYFEELIIVNSVWEKSFVCCVADESLEANKKYKILLTERREYSLMTKEI